MALDLGDKALEPQMKYYNEPFSRLAGPSGVVPRDPINGPILNDKRTDVLFERVQN